MQMREGEMPKLIRIYIFKRHNSDVPGFRHFLEFYWKS